jgi:transposase
MARKRTPIDLSEEEFTTLMMWVRAGKTEKRLVQRAQTILMAAEGLAWESICARTGLSLTNSLKWQRRFLEERLDGLQDRSRKGRPAKFSPIEKAAVMALACSPAPDPYTGWSQRRLAEAAKMSRSSVNRILAGGKIKPHKTQYWCGKSPDPEFEAKQAAIIGLYMEPPDNALVLAVDEKSQIQALDRTQPALPLMPGNARRLTATYTRHGTVCLLAALAVHEGSVDGRCVSQHTHAEFLKFLKHIYRKHPYKHLHVICDNFSAHKHSKVMQWAAKRRRLTLHFTPTYASWLNQIEIWFHIFTRDVLKDGVWPSKKHLIGQILAYIEEYNRMRAKPFAWTYTGKPLAA